jgi:hypothetical protein
MLLLLLHLQVPCSLLAILGECAQELGDTKGATEYYQELVDRAAFGAPGVGLYCMYLYFMGVLYVPVLYCYPRENVPLIMGQAMPSVTRSGFSQEPIAAPTIPACAAHRLYFANHQGWCCSWPLVY